MLKWKIPRTLASQIFPTWIRLHPRSLLLQTTLGSAPSSHPLAPTSTLNSSIAADAHSLGSSPYCIESWYFCGEPQPASPYNPDAHLPEYHSKKSTLNHRLQNSITKRHGRGCGSHWAHLANLADMQPFPLRHKSWRAQQTGGPSCPAIKIGWHLSKVKPLKAPSLPPETWGPNVSYLDNSYAGFTWLATCRALVESTQWSWAPPQYSSWLNSWPHPNKLGSCTSSHITSQKVVA